MSPRVSIRVKDGKVIGASRADTIDPRAASGDQLDEILANAKGLPSFPFALGRIASLISNPTSDAKDYEVAILPDPSLTANVLKMANSPYFGVRKQIGTIKQAVSILGTTRLFDLAVSAWFADALPDRIPGYNISAKSFWIHCVAVGTIAEALAIEGRMPLPDLVFTAGLLHDIGKLAIGTLVHENSDEIGTLMDEQEMMFLEAENKVIGTDHVEIGARLVDQWGLPEALGVVARWHHEPSAVSDERQSLVDLVHLADNMAHSLGFGADFGELYRRLDGDVMDRLLIGSNEIDAAASESKVCQIWEMGEAVTGGIDC